MFPMARKPSEVVFKSERLYIRVVQPNDAEIITHYHVKNKAFHEPWEGLRTADFYQQEVWEKILVSYQQQQENNQALYFLLLNPTQTEVLGLVNVTDIRRQNLQNCWLGYSLAKDMQGKGLMKEALEFIIRYLQSELFLNRIMACHIPSNLRSANVLKSVGFIPEGFFQRFMEVNGYWEDHVICGLVTPRDLF